MESLLLVCLFCYENYPCQTGSADRTFVWSDVVLEGFLCRCVGVESHDERCVLAGSCDVFGSFLIFFEKKKYQKNHKEAC